MEQPPPTHEVSNNVNSPEGVLTEMQIRELRNMSTSKINFSVKLVKAIFKDDELINKNVHGCRGRLALDPVKLLKVRKIYFKTFPSEDEEAEWLKCVNAINSHLRKYVKE